MEWLSNLMYSRPTSLSRSNENGPTNNFGYSDAAPRMGRCSSGGKRDHAVHSIMTSALWAIARTPALVEAIERVESSNGKAPRLSPILLQLRHTNDDAGLRTAAQAAGSFLQSNRPPLDDRIEPMDAIRGIAGLCGDSDKVFEEALKIAYRTRFKCTLDGCSFKRNGDDEEEELLQCRQSTAQLSIETRATSGKKTDWCYMCKRMTAAKSYVMRRAAPCLAATWPCLVAKKSAQEHVWVTTDYGEQIQFKLSVMIAQYQSKFVCMFREGINHFRVEGNNVKQIPASEWKSVQPLLALFNHQETSGSTSPRAGLCPRSGSGEGLSDTPPRSLSSDVGAKARRKRSREHIGRGPFLEGSGRSSSNRAWGPAAVAAVVAVAEVIEVYDDDSGTGGADDLPGDGGSGRDAGDRPGGRGSGSRNGSSGRGSSMSVNGGGGDGEARRETSAGANGLDSVRGGMGDIRTRRGDSSGGGSVGGGGLRQADRILRRALDVEDEPCGEELFASKLARGTTAKNGRRQGLGVGGSGPDSPSVAPTASAPRRRDGAGGDERRENSRQGEAATATLRGSLEVAGDSDGSGGAGDFGRSPLPANGASREAWMGQGGSPTQGGPYIDSGSSTLLSGKMVWPPRRGPQVFDSLEGESRADREDLMTVWGGGDSRMEVTGEGANADDHDTDIQVVTNSQPNSRRDYGDGNRRTVSSSGWIQRRHHSSSPPQSNSNEKGSIGAVNDGSLDCPSPSLPREREVHHVDDHVLPGTTSPAQLPPQPVTASRGGKKHPSGVAMPFIRSSRPSSPDPHRPNAEAAFIGPGPPPKSKLSVFPSWPPKMDQQQAYDALWLTRRDGTRRESRGIFDTAAANKGGRRLAGRSRSNSAAGTNRGVRGKASAGVNSSGGQRTIPSSWEKEGRSSNNTPSYSSSAAASGGSGRSISSFGARSDRTQRGDGASAAEVGGGSRSGSGAGSGSDGEGDNRRQGRIGRGKEKVTEDLTRADDDLSQDAGDWKVVDGVGGGWVSSLLDSNARDDATLTTIRGINLRQDHFERIVDSDGWLTSQIIDIRVKQLQELYPQHLYFDTSFFGFLCPSTEPGGAFVVDYARVRGWTKRSRLPAGKSSLFDMEKLFIPINQGNVHWVLVVVDMESGGGGGGGFGGKGNGESARLVSFFDSFGRDGTTYVEAVQEYLISELSSRDKTRQGLFSTRTRPPANAPRQHNSSDCGILMLHVMEELSTGSVEELGRLNQEEIMSLRLQLVAKIRE